MLFLKTEELNLITSTFITFFPSIFLILLVISYWFLYIKANKPGWACIVPFYRLYVYCEIAGVSPWMFILFYIPVANLIVLILTSIGLAKRFGKSTAFAVGLIFLPIIFIPILAFDKSKYNPLLS